MLHEFLTSNRDELIERCRVKVARRFEPAELPEYVDKGVPLFLRQLADTLRHEQLDPVHDTASAESSADAKAFNPAAALRGSEMQHQGFTVGQVVHGYGDVCQAVTELAVAQALDISTDEFHTLNRCLDNAIADAVTAFTGAHLQRIDHESQSLKRELEHVSDEQRRLVDIAIHAYSAIATGTIGLTGATGTLLLHTLAELRTLMDRALPEV
ncbi:MAG: hypothetical protein ABI537_08560 [Casimicrobiaceae bacterium]